MTISVDTWRSEPLPAETLAAVRAELSSLVEVIVDAVRATSPVYGEVLDAPEGMGIKLGIEQAIRSFLNAVERGQRPAGETDELWRRLGEAEFQAGRSLDDLRSAFRTGTRAAWRGAADMSIRAGVSAQVAIALAEAIFTYCDELATDVVEGYLRMQSDEAGERERRRRRLAQALLDPAGQDPEAVQRAAELARWPLPRTLAVLALAADSPIAVTRRLAVDALAGADAEGAWLVLPDPDGPGRRVALARALHQQAAALGPTVVPPEAHRSLRWARATLNLVREGAIPGGTPPRTTDHLASVLVLQDREMARELMHTRLAPLYELPPVQRARLLETLVAWLAHQRRTPQIAAELHVHSQTVRYRVARLQELLGDALETPDGRFELELALRTRGALGEGESASDRS